MQRVTISLDEALAAEFDALATEQGYQSRSEAVRDLVRHAVESRRNDGDAGGQCVASLSYVYDHHTRAVAQRLIELQHARHDLVVSCTHVHLDHDSCLETALLKGPTREVRELADRIVAERGVRFGKLNLVGLAPTGAHAHGAAPHEHAHVHLSPRRG